MTREDIIRIAWSANLLQVEFSTDIQEMWVGQLERFAALVAEAEREECAKVAAWVLKMPENDVSFAIRARGQE